MRNKKHKGLSEDDIKFIEENLTEGKGFSVKGKEVWLSNENNQFIERFPDNKEEVGFHLAIVLEDTDSLPYYTLLSRTRRRDFLKNCLFLTLKAMESGKIKSNKAKYFTGVVKGKTAQQKRLEEYKKKHTSLYGYLEKNKNNE